MVTNNQLLKSTYAGKKVFLTGHTGFKGAWMLAWLAQLGAQVKGYALAPDQTDGAFNTLPKNLMFESVKEPCILLISLRCNINTQIHIHRMCNNFT